jgi:hypothetical protein
VSVARKLLPTGPLTSNPEFSKTLIDARLNQPTVTRNYSVTFPAATVAFLHSHGFDAKDAAIRTNALKLVGVDVEQMRDFRHVDGSYDWQQGGFWTAATHALTTASTKDSTVTMQNNTNGGVYSVTGPTNNPTKVSTSTSYGVPISLSGQAVECVDQGNGTGSNPAGFSLLNGWDIEDNLPPGVLPPGTMVTEPVDADNGIGPSGLSGLSGLSVAQDIADGTVDVGLSAFGQTSWAWRPPRTARATGWSAPMAGCSLTAMPRSTDRWGTRR